MRRYLISAAAIAGLLIPLSGGVAYAGVGQDGTTGATIIKGSDRPGGNATCGIRKDPTASSFVFSGFMQAEITPSGQINFVCRASVEPGTIAPFNQSGFVCHLGPFGDTFDSHVVWTKSGQGTLTCHGTTST